MNLRIPFLKALQVSRQSIANGDARPVQPHFGKSTLVDLLAGRRRPTSGSVETGPTVVVGYYDQTGVELDLSARVQDLVAGPSRTPGSLADVALMKRFWFGGELPYARVGTLSGGERRRLQLLLVLVGRPNVLFLDEPTNDLDLDTLRILEDFLERLAGSAGGGQSRPHVPRPDHRAARGRRVGRLGKGVAGGVAAWVARVQGSGSGSGSRLRHRPRPVRTTEDGDSAAAPLGRLLREAEKEVVRRQRQRDRLTQALTEVADHQAMIGLGAQLQDAQQALDEAEERWLVLAERAESRS